MKALIDLQSVDLDISALRKASEVHPKRVTVLEKELGQAESALEAERAKLADLERQKRQLEQNISDEKDKVKKWEGRLAEQRSTREYAALAREIDIAKKANQTMAEALVELSKAVSVAREGVKSKELEFLGHQEEISTEIASLKQKMAETDTQVAELGRKRSGYTGAVEKQLLGRYDAVRKKRMPALVSVQGGTCQGCNMNVPPQLYNTLLTTKGLDVCPSCHRIIYAADATEAGTR